MNTLAITMYLLHGSVTYCGVPVEDAPPFVAVPVRQYWSGEMACWDKVGILVDGEVKVFYALDAIPDGNWCVEQPDGTCLPILVDVPSPYAWFPGLSTVGQRVWNVSALQRAWTARQGDARGDIPW